MDKTISFTVNGRKQTVTTDPQRPLLEVLREDLELTGTKRGCGEGRCGACTVLIEGKRNHSCMMPIAEVENKSILTIEGLASANTLHPVQEAFLAEAGMQCGFCTPGMILSTVELLKTNKKPSDAQILEWMNGHICRCCGYPNILKSVRRAASEARS